MKVTQKIGLMTVALCFMLSISNLKAIPNDSNPIETKGYRDYFEDCSTKITGTINGVSVNFSTTGSKNNCRESENNTCNAAGCKSQAVSTIINAIIK